MINTRNRKGSFNSTSTRFAYPTKQKEITAPGTYNIRGQFESTRGRSFGLGRDQSFKLFVDEIVNDTKKNF